MKEKLIPRHELIIGEIYTHQRDDSRGNVFCWGGSDAQYYTGNNRDVFCNSGGGGFNQDKNMVATPFEKAWLLEMRRTGTFIPENQFIFENSYQIY